MRFQETSYSCGAAAILNVARCFGKRIPERVARSIAETTPDGTDEDGIINALATLGLEGKKFSEQYFDSAIEYIRKNLNASNGYPSIICTQNMQHWVVIIGGTDNYERYIIIDSSRTKRNLKENGIQILSKKELRKIWQERGTPTSFFGITVQRLRKKRKKK